MTSRARRQSPVISTADQELVASPPSSSPSVVDVAGTSQVHSTWVLVFTQMCPPQAGSTLLHALMSPPNCMLVSVILYFKPVVDIDRHIAPMGIKPQCGSEE